MEDEVKMWTNWRVGVEREICSRDRYGVGRKLKPLYGKRMGMAKYMSLKDSLLGGPIQEKLYEALESLALTFLFFPSSFFSESR